MGKMPVEAFTDALAQEAGVMLLPGTMYDYPGGHFRLGLGRENIPEALERLKKFIKTRF
jgi:aspartate/methionine/tyrosine aminotransferase